VLALFLWIGQPSFLSLLAQVFTQVSDGGIAPGFGGPPSTESKDSEELLTFQLCPVIWVIRCYTGT